MLVKRQQLQIAINVKLEEKFANNAEIISLFRWIENNVLFLAKKALVEQVISFAIKLILNIVYFAKGKAQFVNHVKKIITCLIMA